MPWLLGLACGSSRLGIWLAKGPQKIWRSCQRGHAAGPRCRNRDLPAEGMNLLLPGLFFRNAKPWPFHFLLRYKPKSCVKVAMKAVSKLRPMRGQILLTSPNESYLIGRVHSDA